MSAKKYNHVNVHFSLLSRTALGLFGVIAIYCLGMLGLVVFMISEALYVTKFLPRSYKADWSTSKPYEGVWLPIISWVFAICAFIIAAFLVPKYPDFVETFIKSSSKPFEILTVHGMKSLSELEPTNLGVKMVVSFWIIVLSYPVFSMVSITTRPLKRDLTHSSKIVRFFKVMCVLIFIILCWWKFSNLLTLEKFGYGYFEFISIHLAIWMVLILAQPFLNSTIIGDEDA